MIVSRAAIAYATLAGVPPEFGIYSTVVPCIVYALLGTSRELAVGPVALSSLLVQQALAPFALSGAAYTAAAVLITFLSGATQVVFGLLQLGVITNFLAAPVVAGFTTASGLLIGLSQIRDAFG